MLEDWAMQGTIIKRDLTKPLCCIGYLLAISCLFCAVTARAAPHSLNFTQWDQTTHNGSWLINPAGTTAHGVQHLGEVDYHAAAILRKQFHAVDFANELPGTLRFDYSLVIDGPAVTGFAHCWCAFLTICSKHSNHGWLICLKLVMSR